eukprot:RCo026907
MWRVALLGGLLPVTRTFLARPLCRIPIPNALFSITSSGGSGAPIDVSQQQQQQQATPDWEAVAKKHGATVGSSDQVGGPGVGPKSADMALVFTCGRCGVRTMKSFTRLSYERGVVIVQCPGCKSLHLVADNLGWFGDERNIEEIMKAKGEAVLRSKMKDGEFVLA